MPYEWNDGDDSMTFFMQAREAELLRQGAPFASAPIAPEPTETPPEPDMCIITTEAYQHMGFWDGRRVPGHPRYMMVPRDEVSRMVSNFGYSRPRMWSVAEIDSLPQVRYCAVCERRMYVNSDTCERCAARPRATRAALRNGGRRFGIEIEFSLPGHSYGAFDPDPLDDYGFDDPNVEADLCDEPDCVSCNHLRRERLGYGPSSSSAVTSMEGIADALMAAGVNCCVPGYTHQVFEGQWKLVTDGSVNDGYELVSPPLQWRDADQVRTACQVLTNLGMRATEDCGLHVHHDVGELTAKTAPVLAKNFAALYSVSQQLCAPYRSSSQWCYPSQQYARVEAAYNGDSLADFLNIDGERYRPLNWTCWQSYGTVEVRMHESTLDAEEILAWIAYTQSIVEASMRGDEIEPPTNLDDCLSKITIRRAANPSHVRHMLRLKAEQRNERRLRR